MASEKQSEEVEVQLDNLIERDQRAVVACRAVGPYAGCHWEMCYFFIQGPRRGSWSVRPVHMAGDLATEFEKRADRDTQKAKFWLKFKLKSLMSGTGGDYIDFEVLPVDTTLARRLSLNFYQSFIAVLGNNFQWECTECGSPVSGGPCYHHGYRGNGGVGIVHTDAVCENCEARGTCRECRTYLGVDDVDEPTQRCLDCLAKFVVESAGQQLRPTGGVRVRRGKEEYLERTIEALGLAGRQLVTYCEVRPVYAEKAKKQHADALVSITRSIRKVLVVR